MYIILHNICNHPYISFRAILTGYFLDLRAFFRIWCKKNSSILTLTVSDDEINLFSIINMYISCSVQWVRTTTSFANKGSAYSKSEIKAIEQAYTLDPDNDDLRYRLIKAYILNEHYVEARCMLSKTLNENSSSIEANYLMGLTYSRQDLYEEAKLFYNKVLEQDQTHIPTLFNLAVIDGKTSNCAQANVNDEQILEQKPTDPDTHYNLALLYDIKFIDSKNALYHYRLYLRNAQDSALFRQRKPLILERIKELEFIEREKNL